MGTFEVIIADPNKSAEESFAEILHSSNRAAVLNFARELNEKADVDGIWKKDFLSVLRNHGIEEKELMK